MFYGFSEIKPENYLIQNWSCAPIQCSFLHEVGNLTCFKRQKKLRKTGKLWIWFSKTYANDSWLVKIKLFFFLVTYNYIIIPLLNSIFGSVYLPDLTKLNKLKQSRKLCNSIDYKLLANRKISLEKKYDFHLKVTPL